MQEYSFAVELFAAFYIDKGLPYLNSDLGTVSELYQLAVSHNSQTCQTF